MNRIAVPFLLLAGLLVSEPAYSVLSNAECDAVRVRHRDYGQELCRRALADPRSGHLQFALAALYLNERVGQGNERLRQAYAEALEGSDELPPTEVMDPAHAGQSKVKWAMRGWLRVYYMFHDRSSFFPGRLENDVQKMLEELFWNYGAAKSTVTRAQPEFIWMIQGSENHDMMDLSNAFLALQAVKDLLGFKNRQLPDGHTPAEHVRAWTQYYKLYCSERAKHGLFVEISPTYGKYFLPELVNMWEFAEDAELRRRMEMLLHLAWADWSIDQLEGIRGGGGTRVYQGHYAQRGTSNSWNQMGKILLGQGDWFPTEHYQAQFVLGMTQYRLPDVVIDLALNPRERGVYVYKSLRPAKLGEPRPGKLDDVEGYWMDGNDPHMLRYSYCTPEYILGGWMLDPGTRYAAINTQNRWQGIIFATGPNARVFPQCVGLRNGKTYNQHIAVQSRNVLIVQKNRVHTKQVGPMRIFFSPGMKSRLMEKDGWLFLKEGDAYLAIAVLPRLPDEEPGFFWEEDRWLTTADDFAPVAFVAGRAVDHSAPEDFVAYVGTHRFHAGADATTGSNLLHYEFEDVNGQTTTISMDTEDHENLPRVNGKVIDLTPESVFESPFLWSEHGSGVITIQKEPRKLELDFESKR